MDRAMLALIFSLFGFFLIQGSKSTTFMFQNKCPYTVWPATLQGGKSQPLSKTGFELGSGSSPVSLNAPNGWIGRFWARTQCSMNSGKFSCQTGDCGSGQVACNGAGGATPTTLAEFTLNGDGGKDFYDVSQVDGFNLPLSVVPQGGSRCNSTSCSSNVNSLCPSELQVKAANGAVIGCNSACAKFNTDEYCCRGANGTAETCHPNRYSMIFKKACPQAYSYAYDDRSSTLTCTGASGYLMTFCP